MERTAVVLWVTLGAVVLNALATYALVFGRWGLPEMGIRGAALATVIVEVTSVAALAAYAHGVAPERAIFARLWRPDRVALGRVFRLGWPIGLTSLSEVGLFSATAVLMGWVGTLPLAAHGIVLQICALTFMVHLGLSHAATVRAGQARARDDGDRLRIEAAAAYGLSMVMALATAAVFLLGPEPLIGAFLSSDDPQRAAILAVGIPLLAVGAAFQLFDGAQVTALGLLRGVQDTRVPMGLAAVGYWGIGLPTALLLGFVAGWDGVGVWSGLVTGLAVAGVLLTRRLLRRWLRPPR